MLSYQHLEKEKLIKLNAHQALAKRNGGASANERFCCVCQADIGIGGVRTAASAKYRRAGSICELNESVA